MPELIKLYNEYKDVHDQFEIVTLHDGSVKTMAELDDKTKQHVKSKWRGPLPFPVLLDGTGKTTQAWGISAFPTVVLIDPAGKLIAHIRDHKELRRKLQELRASK